MSDILSGYAEAATPDFIAAYEAISSHAIYEKIADVLPTIPVRVVDIGAGTGRDAAWFAAQGHDVLAVEPVDALRNAGIELHASPKIEWQDDQLPELVAVRRRGRFNLVNLCGVWQHLDRQEQERAIVTLGERQHPAEA